MEEILEGGVTKAPYIHTVLVQRGVADVITLHQYGPPSLEKKQ